MSKFFVSYIRRQDPRFLSLDREVLKQEERYHWYSVTSSSNPTVGGTGTTSKFMKESRLNSDQHVNLSSSKSLKHSLPQGIGPVVTYYLQEFFFLPNKHTHKHTHARVYTLTHIHTQIHGHVHIHIYIYIFSLQYLCKPIVP